jgi:CRP-like cAMP-binding protein
VDNQAGRVYSENQAFEDLGFRGRHLLARQFEIIEFNRGEKVYFVSSHDRNVYMVLKGSFASVVSPSPRSSDYSSRLRKDIVVLEQYKTREFFGGLETFNDFPRLSTVVAELDSSFICKMNLKALS